MNGEGFAPRFGSPPEGNRLPGVCRLTRTWRTPEAFPAAICGGIANQSTSPHPE
jgi:hypothetical protein